MIEDRRLRLYTSSEVCALAGITYRQLDYWDRTGFLLPQVAAAGSGTQRLFSRAEVQVAAVAATAKNLPPTSHLARRIANHVRQHGLRGSIVHGPWTLDLELIPDPTLEGRRRAVSGAHGLAL
jgi:hypothetical protein